MTVSIPVHDPKKLVRHLRQEDFEPISKHPGNDYRDGGEVCTLVSEETTASQDLWVGLLRMWPGQRRRKHHHPHASEFYLVTKGECTLHIAGKDVRATYGTTVYVPANVVHAVRNDSDAVCEVIVGFNSPTLEGHGIVFDEE